MTVPQPAAGPLRLALIGAGGIADRHLDAADAHPDVVRFVSVVDASEKAISKVRARLPQIRVHDSADKLAAAGGFDAAVICTPHFLHFEQAAAVVRAGCSVLVEKPLVTSTEQMRRLHEIATASGATVIAGQTRRHSPDVVRARSAMSSAVDFGGLRSFDIQSLQDARPFTGPSHWLLDGRLAGGGVAISLAIHQIDMIRFLTGADYTAALASARFDAPFRNGAESQVSAVLELSNGARGTLHADYLATRIPFAEAMTLIGEHGSLVQHAAWVGQYRGPLSYSTSEGVPSVEFKQQLGGWRQLSDDLEHAEEAQEAFTRQMLHFAAVVRGEQEPVSSLADNFNTIACVEAIAASAARRQRVEVEQW